MISFSTSYNVLLIVWGGLDRCKRWCALGSSKALARRLRTLQPALRFPVVVEREQLSCRRGNEPCDISARHNLRDLGWRGGDRPVQGEVCSVDTVSEHLCSRTTDWTLRCGVPETEAQAVVVGVDWVVSVPARLSRSRTSLLELNTPSVCRLAERLALW